MVLLDTDCGFYFIWKKKMVIKAQKKIVSWVDKRRDVIIIVLILLICANGIADILFPF